MCFSATASFTVGGATALVGIAALRHVRSWRDVPMAAVPLLFAAQQAIEGALWLEFDGIGGAEHVSFLSHAYLIFAEVVWPAWVPVAVLFIEPERARRRLAGIVAALGLAVAALLLIRLLDAPAAARVVGHSIWYSGDDAIAPWALAVYLVCTSAVLFISSHRMIRLFGVVVAIGFAVSVAAHYATLFSVWCFFAAAGSTILLFHFRRLRLDAIAAEVAAFRAQMR